MLPINSYIDHTLLKSTATRNDITTLCSEAKTNDFFSVCINGCYVALCANLLRNSKIKICTVVGFPLGTMTTRSKLFEAEDAISNGADEIDMVINLGALKSGEFNLVESEISSIKNIIGIKVLKVIIETCYLTSEQISIASKLIESAGADFVKTSTGFGTKGASLDAITEIKKAISHKMEIKASGGIRDFITAKTYIDLGVSRIGTSSGVAILNGSKSSL